MLDNKFIKILFSLFAIVCLSTAATAYNVQYAESVETQLLSWKNKKIAVAFSKSFLNPNLTSIPESEVNKAINNSLAAWEAAAGIEFVQGWTDNHSISPQGKTGDGVNLITIAQTSENLLLFSGDSIEHAARTRVFFNRQGTITEADIVLNPYARFSTDGSIGTYDLESVLMHEIGHLLGLDHSETPASTMFEQQGKNGVYNLQSFSPRTLAGDDIARIRALYGAATQTDDCCGAIGGKISGKKGVSQSFRLFVEEANTGRYISGGFSDNSGYYLIEGLPPGHYNVFVKNAASEYNSVQKLSEVEVSVGKTTTLNKKIEPETNDFSLRFIGFNSQITNLAVPLNRGKSYQVFVAGKHLNAKNYEFNINSPFIKVNPETIAEHNFGRDISVISFEVILSPDVPNGEFSISASDSNGKTDYLFGSLSVEEMKNPWYKFTF